MKLMKIRFFILLFCSVALSTTTWSCRFGFMTVAGGNLSEKEAGETYLQILNELASDLSPSAVDQMIIKGDPFTLPKDHSQSSATLSETLKEFEQLLIGVGENSKELKEHLLDVLIRAKRMRNETNEKQKVVDRKEVSPEKIPWEENELPQPRISPDDRTIFIPGEDNASLWVSENWLTPKKFHPIGERIVHFSHFEIAPDGKNVFYTLRNRDNTLGHLLYRAKIFDDKGDFIKKWEPELWATLAEEKGEHRYFGSIEASSDGKWMIAHGSNRAFLISFENKPTKEIKRFLPVSPFGSQQVVFLPNAKEIMVFGSGEANFYDLQGRQTRAELNFKTTPANKSPRINPNKFYIMNDEATLYSLVWDNGLAKINLKTGETNQFDLTKNSNGTKRFGGFAVDKKEKYAFVVGKNRGVSGEGVLLTIDLASGNIINETTLNNKTPEKSPEPEEIKMNHKGDKLIVSYYSSRAMTIHRYEDLVP